MCREFKGEYLVYVWRKSSRSASWYIGGSSRNDVMNILRIEERISFKIISSGTYIFLLQSYKYKIFNFVLKNYFWIESFFTSKLYNSKVKNNF